VAYDEDESSVTLSDWEVHKADIIVAAAWANTATLGSKIPIAVMI